MAERRNEHKTERKKQITKETKEERQNKYTHEYKKTNNEKHVRNKLINMN